MDSAAYVSLAVAGLGVAACALSGLPATRSVPVWLLGTYCIYARHKIALSKVKTPSLNKLHILSTALALFVLLAVPIYSRDWILLGGIAIALVAGLAYSHRAGNLLPPLRNLPLVKLLLPWGVATAALTLLPMHNQGWHVSEVSRVFAASLWAACILLANILWCDLRDLESDCRHKVLSLPGLLGKKRTRWILAILSPAALAMGCLASQSSLHLSICALGALAIATLATIDPSTIDRLPSELLVEGMLMLPATPLLIGLIISLFS